MRGENLNLNSSLPTFFINTYSEKNFRNRYYATTDRLMFRACWENQESILERFNYDDPDKNFFILCQRAIS